jgi:hypothetical protein
VERPVGFDSEHPEQFRWRVRIRNVKRTEATAIITHIKREPKDYETYAEGRFKDIQKDIDLTNVKFAFYSDTVESP